MIELVLLKDVLDLGQVGDIVKVKNGYARNYLIPHQMASRATPEAIADFEQKKEILMAERQKKIEMTQSILAKIDNMTLKIEANADQEGNLYGSITQSIVFDKLREIYPEVEHTITKNKIQIKNGMIKKIGEYPVSINWSNSELEASFSVSVVKLNSVIGDQENTHSASPDHHSSPETHEAGQPS